MNQTSRGFREGVCLKMVLKISGIWTKEKKERVFQVEEAQHRGMGVRKKQGERDKAGNSI